MDRNAAARRSVLTDRGSLEHYADPAYYDHSYANRIDDVTFYAARATKHARVLEYGIGNGRVAIPIARHGTHVTGVDHSPPMLASLRARLSKEKLPIAIKQGDMRTVKLRTKFPFVFCAFNGVLHLYTREDAEQFFARVLAHLEPRGTFACDLNVPSLIDLARDPDRPYRIPPFRHPRVGIVKYGEQFDFDMKTQVLHVRMRFEPREGEAFEQTLTHRQFFPQEWEMLLHYNGLEIVEMYGDYDGTPFDRDSDQLVCIARRRRGW